MKTLLLLVFCLSLLSLSFSQTPMWTWVGGSNYTDEYSVSGTQGTGTTSTYPGAREDSASWIDSDGNFWLFGGFGYTSDDYGYLNDLWKYDTTSSVWTWMHGSDVAGEDGVYGTKGTGTTSTVPGARTASNAWTDSNGNLWLFGGLYSDEQFNDLWKYDTTSNTWTWMHGSDTMDDDGVYGTKGTGTTSTVPGARDGAASWTDSDGATFWLFGGSTDADFIEYRNDLWKYVVSSNTWTWVGGTNDTNQDGVYGTQGTGTTSTTPGSRWGATAQTDLDGNLWLFGGNTFDFEGYEDYSNDLWMYDTTYGTWTWVSGSDESGDDGVYGTKGTGTTSTTPGGREPGASWVDGDGNFWLFGGYGYTFDDYGGLNDLWMFDGTWTWVAGSNETYEYGIYGTKGTGTASTTPGVRRKAITWADSDGNLWLFGGEDLYYDEELNDLWVYASGNGADGGDGGDGGDGSDGGDGEGSSAASLREMIFVIFIAVVALA